MPLNICRKRGKQILISGHDIGRIKVQSHDRSDVCSYSTKMIFRRNIVYTSIYIWLITYIFKDQGKVKHNSGFNYGESLNLYMLGNLGLMIFYCHLL